VFVAIVGIVGIIGALRNRSNGDVEVWSVGFYCVVGVCFLKNSSVFQNNISIRNVNSYHTSSIRPARAPQPLPIPSRKWQHG
jgi:hypothetical protein